MLPQVMTNPLLEKSTLPFGAFPFDQVRTELYMPGLDRAIELGKANISRIREVPVEQATFENVIVALETSTEAMGRVQTIFFNLLSAHGNEEMHKLAKEIGPKSAQFDSDITLDPKLFELVKAVYERRETLSLDGEAQMLLDKTYRHFKRNGALLDEAGKVELRKIDMEMAALSPQFSENVLKATNEFKLWIDRESDLAGLPANARTAAREAAVEAGQPERWLFNLHAPSYMPFMTYSEKRELREQMWRVYNSRALGGINDNRSVMKSIVDLRHRRARLLGYKTHADFVLEERMADSPDKVFRFLDALMEKSRGAGERDWNEVKNLYQRHTGRDGLMPWDYAFYSEKLKLEQLQFDEEKLRPYFRLEKVIDGVFEHARRLYGIKLKEITNIPKYHPDVRTYEVLDDSGHHIGLFYADFFPRAEKQGGAWMTSFRDQGLQGGQIERPHIAIVCNFTKPTADAPSLLTHEEVQTLFHEFGHALHGLLSDVKYVSLGGTHVYWDFVELPSQIMENWTSEKEALDLFAEHYQTGEKIPADLARKIKDSQRFQAGYAMLRQLGFSYLDMAWHSSDPSKIEDISLFEQKALEKSRLVPPIEGTLVSTAFSHIFAGGYSAGYYSYKWAEVLDADAFEYIKGKGLFNRDVTMKFKNEVLARGGTEHPMTLYKRFRGQEPDPNALLRRAGLIDGQIA